jgi:hypothetical protein
MCHHCLATGEGFFLGFFFLTLNTVEHFLPEYSISDQINNVPGVQTSYYKNNNKYNI